MTTLESADLAFMRDYKVYLDQAKMDFIHGMQPHVRNHYEMLYKKYLDKNFILTTWCGQCVIDMMKRIATLYDQSTELKHPEPSTGDDVPETPFPDVLEEIVPNDQNVWHTDYADRAIREKMAQDIVAVEKIKRKRGRPRKA
jgi:hypothetical protein